MLLNNNSRGKKSRASRKIFWFVLVPELTGAEVFTRSIACLNPDGSGCVEKYLTNQYYLEHSYGSVNSFHNCLSDYNLDPLYRTDFTLL
ncbi:hypothetical protein L873DRAFT_211160 [Choiromyces venosus 120613-1]|uniref:Uncharacterized protein n=1 Tax=Choiromyces venosus 120613-1 TaxID=1336337 RepID=A0A3N4J6A6_9PEZI|nr:hypothetical protein L873DRAFT_211160 [Choiromyces venosus 120613-1]